MNRGANKAIFAVIILAAVAFVAAVAVSVVHQRRVERQALHTLLDSVDVMRKRHTAESVALDARFKEVDIDQYLKPDKVVDKAQVAAGRAALGRFRALLVERDQVADEQMARAHALLLVLPEGQMREDSLRGEAAGNARLLALRKALTKAQTDNADVVDAMFDWADANHAIIKARDGHLVVYSAAALGQLQALGERLKRTVTAVDDSIARIHAEQASSSGTLERLRQTVDQ